MIINWWKNKQNAYQTEYFSAIKRTEVLIHATMWINFNSIILVKENQAQCVTYKIMFKLNTQIREIQRDNKQVYDLPGNMRKQ